MDVRLRILNFIKSSQKPTTVDGVRRTLGISPYTIDMALKSLMRKGFVTQNDGYALKGFITQKGMQYFTYAGRFVRFRFSTGEKLPVGPMSKSAVLKSQDFMLEPERITLTNRTDEEFAVTFNITGIESAELARKVAFVVDEETDKETRKLCRATPPVSIRPILEKKAITLDRLLPRQTKKYGLKFVITREYIEKVPKNELNCTLKINCISLNYHDFIEMSVELYPGWL